MSQQPQEQKPPHPWAVGGFIIGMLTVIFALAFWPESKPKANTDPEPAPKMFHGLLPGEVGVLGGPSGKAWIAPDYATATQIAGYGSDSESAARIINASTTIVLGGTRAKFLEGPRGSYDVVRVAVLDGPDKGTTGWVLGVYLRSE